MAQMTDIEMKLEEDSKLLIRALIEAINNLAHAMIVFTESADIETDDKVEE